MSRYASREDLEALGVWDLMLDKDGNLHLADPEEMERSIRDRLLPPVWAVGLWHWLNRFTMATRFYSVRDVANFSAAQLEFLGNALRDHVRATPRA